MIDRFRSIYSTEGLSEKLSPEPDVRQRPELQFQYNREIVERTNSHAARMREYISKYKRNIGREEGNIIADFKEEQARFAKDRNLLKSELDKLQREKKKDTPEYNFMKKQLLRAIKNEIDLELELNQEITKQKDEKQELKKRLLSTSPLLANAVRDIEARRADILYLEQQINECLQLLEIIGILTNETGQKLDSVSERVRRANQNIEMAEANIDKAKIAMERSRCRMCCIILLALVAIGLILVVLFGLHVGGL